MKEPKFYKCAHCGNIITKIEDKGVPVFCCGQKMDELVPNTSDGAGEKHVPVVEVNGKEVKVVVGEVAHPMAPEHFIEWVSLQTKLGNQRKVLVPGAAPEVSFLIEEGDEVEAVYAYCNLHGLWKA